MLNAKNGPISDQLWKHELFGIIGGDVVVSVRVNHFIVQKSFVSAEVGDATNDRFGSVKLKDLNVLEKKLMEIEGDDAIRWHWSEVSSWSKLCSGGRLGSLDH